MLSIRDGSKESKDFMTERDNYQRKILEYYAPVDYISCHLQYLKINIE